MKALIKIIIFVIVIVILSGGIFMKITSKNSTYYANGQERQAKEDINTKEEDNIKDQEKRS